MKNLKIIAALFLTVCLVILNAVSCTKEKRPEQAVTTASSGLVNSIIEPRLSDTQLIESIQGLNPKYAHAADLFELLLDNAPLSESVLEAIITETVLEDDFVEVMFVVSAPVSEGSLGQLQGERPSIGLTGIAQAQTKPEDFTEFTIVNYPVKRIIFGERLARVPVVTEGCTGCSSIIRNIAPSGIIVSIDFGVGTGEPVFLREKKCNPDRWICGKVVDAEKAGAGEIVTCDGDKGKCIRKVAWWSIF